MLSVGAPDGIVTVAVQVPFMAMTRIDPGPGFIGPRRKTPDFSHGESSRCNILARPRCDCGKAEGRSLMQVEIVTRVWDNRYLKLRLRCIVWRFGPFDTCCAATIR